MKSPAFRFYIQDFLVGTMSFKVEEVGAYLLLLIYQWDHGYVPATVNDLCSIARCKEKTLAKVLTKFRKNDDGSLYNMRLEEERVKQELFNKKQAENGAKGGRPKKGQAPNDTKNKPVGFSGLTQCEAKESLSFSLSSSLSENENNTPLPPGGDASHFSDSALFMESFEKFWDIYGKKVDRSKCERKFKKLNPAEREAVIVHVPKYVASTPNEQYRKNPLTYLTGRCWLDEHLPSEAGNKGIPTGNPGNNIPANGTKHEMVY
jgi:uncharacterized protein YdaU (DUF1376 family)